MAKKSSINVQSGVSLQILLQEYQTYAQPYLQFVLNRIKSSSNKTIIQNIAVGLHPIGLSNTKSQYLKYCVANVQQLANVKFIPRSSHQKCIKTQVINNFVKNVQQQNLLHKYNSTYIFEDVYNDITKLRVKGVLGDLFIYDATLRLAHIFGIEPKQYVYLHAGALVGAKELEKRGFINLKQYTKNWTIHRVPVSLFSKLFPSLSSKDIENFLCIAKGYFPTMIVP